MEAERITARSMLHLLLVSTVLLLISLFSPGSFADAAAEASLLELKITTALKQEIFLFNSTAPAAVVTPANSRRSGEAGIAEGS